MVYKNVPERFWAPTAVGPIEELPYVFVEWSNGETLVVLSSKHPHLDPLRGFPDYDAYQELNLVDLHTLGESYELGVIIDPESFDPLVISYDELARLDPYVPNVSWRADTEPLRERMANRIRFAWQGLRRQPESSEN